MAAIKATDKPIGDAAVASAETATGEGSGTERRRTPRRRVRDRIASLDTTDNPMLRGQYDIRNLMLLVDDDLRQTALALGAIEAYLATAAALLEKSDLTGAALVAVADDEAVLDRMEDLSENMDNLRRRMSSIAAALK